MRFPIQKIFFHALFLFVSFDSYSAERVIREDNNEKQNSNELVPALTMAVMCYDYDTVFRLIGCGVDPKNTSGSYSLVKKTGIYILGCYHKCSLVHIPAYYGDLKMLELLVGSGADIYGLDWQGKQPIDVAFDQKIKEYLQFVDRVNVTDLSKKYWELGFCGEETVAYLWPLLPWKSVHFFEWHRKHNPNVLENFLIKSGRLEKWQSGAKWIYFALAKQVPWNFEKTRSGLNSCFSYFQFFDKPGKYEEAVLAFIKTLELKRKQNDMINKDKSIWRQREGLYSHITAKKFNSIQKFGYEKLVDCRIKFENC